MKKMFIAVLCLITSMCLGATRAIVPNADGEGSIGTNTAQWGSGWYASLWLNGTNITTLFDIIGAGDITNNVPGFTNNTAWHTNLNVNGEITLGGVARTSWPVSGGGDAYLVGTNNWSGPSNTFLGTVWVHEANITSIIGDGGSVSNLNFNNITNLTSFTPYIISFATSNDILLINGNLQYYAPTNTTTIYLPGSVTTQVHSIRIDVEPGTNSFSFGTNNLYYSTNVTIGVGAASITIRTNGPTALNFDKAYNSAFWRVFSL